MKIASYLPDRVSTPEGIFILDSTGHYIPEAEREEKSPLIWMLLYSLAAIGGLAFIGAGYAFYRVFEALAS